MEYPSRVLQRAVEEISQLPGIGKRTALRLALHMIQRPASQTIRLSDALQDLVQELNACIKCHNFSDEPICSICNNPFRDERIICVVEDVRDVMAIENTGQFKGKYHVLGGKISPIDGIGPDELNIESLLKRVEEEKVNELIFALSATIEGDTTIFYLFKKMKNSPIRFSTIARGIGVGDELEYTDEMTLARSIENRIPYTESFTT